ncbi:hypothetical protein [Marinobacterium rhizophilum]|uniref:Uncharacterized protein n=1 Tax=Marinobacterium rhizophilum TaxID=420402 RepID=A0ABY5HME1_9GAMM|nr:hypothetical protein [Marinobacterium rhizophilum]UTW13558.1 hypothetical protein KDW95_07935 [Marinobacterium rhizophilum]
MQPDREPLNRLDSTDPEPAPAMGGGLDRGFGHMLQQAAISPQLAAELASDQPGCRLSPLEKTLLARWPVPAYAAVLRDPVQALEEGRPDYDIFLEGAQLVLDELSRFDISELIELRFPVGGVLVGWHRFELSDLFLGQIWLAQAPMLDWLAGHGVRLEALAARARPYALAQAALWVERETGQNREQAIVTGQLYPYLQRLFGAAFNLLGVNPLQATQVSTAGFEPLLLAGGALRLEGVKAPPGRAFSMLDINVRCTTAGELRCAAQLLYEQGLLGAQSCALLSHADCFQLHEVQLQAANSTYDWIDVFEQALAALWMHGDLGDSVQAVVSLLKSADLVGQVEPVSG